jgi:crossover junction endodeoxyribonuclease RuvC
MGLDPSIAAFGFAVLHHDLGAARPVVLEMGAWITKPDKKAKKLEDRADRVGLIGARLVELIEHWKPAEAYVEGLALGMATSRLTAQTLGRVRGLAEGICIAAGIPILEVSAQAVKQAVTGRRDASKELVARLLVQQFPIARGVMTLDATDALAVAHVGAHRYGGAVVVKDNVVRYGDPDGLLDF